MNWVVEMSIFAFFVLLLTFGLAIRKLGFAASRLPVTASWIDEISVDRYRPMARLLDGSDLDFLESQPGCTPAILRKLRRERYQLFRSYLDNLHQDFARLCSATEMYTRRNGLDRPDLAATLIRRRLLFGAHMATAHCRLALHRWGICRVDVAGLLASFDLMRTDLLRLVPAAVPVGA